MTEAFEMEEHLRGPHDERLRALKTAWFDMVIPRYLRPLESNGRSVTPCLIHADLWPGNCRYTRNMDTVCVYDANTFWGKIIKNIHHHSRFESWPRNGLDMSKE